MRIRVTCVAVENSIPHMQMGVFQDNLEGVKYPDTVTITMPGEISFTVGKTYEIEIEEMP